MIPNFPLGDMSVDTFLRDYWQKKPLLIRNAFPEFEPPVSADELAGLACEEEVESRLVIQNATGEQWELENGPFSGERFANLQDSHWTLLVQAVDHWAPEANALLEQFRFIPSWRIDDLMVSYATKGGGVGPHYDNYDVFLIQASGQRRWEVGGIYGEDSPRRDDTPVMILPEWDAEQTYLLNPGDMLYIPPRIGHNGTAESDDCMTYSVGFRAPSHADILRQFTDFVGEQLKSETRYSDPELTLQKSPGLIRQSDMEKVRSIMTDYLNEPELLENWFGQYMTEQKYADQAGTPEENENYSVEELTEYLHDGGLIYRAEGSRFAYRERTDGSVVLFVNGEACDISQESASFARNLCDLPAISAEHANNAEAQEVLTELYNMEAVYTEE
ncbi:cupin domain-containing protein [Neptunomonas japonica]|uniref:Cupin 4 family protein n=1 Tax=Neptunomonas japonica JAMM 1380 TaxID=1441457 RepID=A0A7R6PCJ8_9GAMM|nr:cupin domain-containing protein [Neptunomonas japonica]BBB29994.1 cupin 4 family protein [Neptunomonas japonica JAMM 1380]